MPNATEPTAGDPEIRPSALAKALAEITEHLAKALPSVADGEARRQLAGSLEGLQAISSSLRAIDLHYHPDHARQFARHGEGLRRLALAMGGIVSDLTLANQRVAARLDEHVDELQKIAALPPDSGITARLEVTVAHVRQMAAEMNESFNEIARKLTAAAESVPALEGELREARERALRDSLTRVHSRAALDDRLDALVRQGEAAGPWAFLLIDLDHFRLANETHGQIVGDALLFKVARTAEEVAPAEERGGFLARVGGEEFAVLLAGAGLAEASRVAEQVRVSVAAARWQHRAKPGRAIVHITVSVGVVQHRAGEAAAELLARAEAALRQAKAAGRNRVVAV